MAIKSDAVDGPTEQVGSDDSPPFFSSWNQIYAVVLILHAFIIVMFYLFTHAYS